MDNGRLDVAPCMNSNRRTPLSGRERWYVTRTLPRQEARAEIQLLQQGFTVFLPRAIRTVRHARKLLTVKSALFPNYMFVALDVERDRWRSINGTRGVSNLIMRGDLPEPVPSGVVENLLDLTDEDDVIQFDSGLCEGQEVRVVAGPFASAIGRLERMDANGRVRVLLDIMNGKVRGYVARSALQAV